MPTSDPGEHPLEYPGPAMEGGTDELGDQLGRMRLAADTLEGERQRGAVKARLLGEPQPETRIDRFVVLERLGAGGMGVVYTAYDPHLDRRVAIKIVRTWGTEKRAVDQQRLLREARALARLSHPNVVAVYEVGLREGDVFIAMELVRGRTLRDAVAGLAGPAVLDAYQQAGRGLAAAHGVGIVHRDFKPDNALVGEDGRVRVLDFGIAHDEGTTEAPSADGRDRGSPLTGTGAVIGTLAYMAPEQQAGLPATAQSDQLSFCVALHEALVGELPESGENGRRCASALPTWLRGVLARGMADDPDARWPSMDALLQALGRDPTRTRRRLLIAAVPIVAIAAVLGGKAVVDRQRDAACVEASAAIRETWNDDRRAAIAAAFAGTGAPFAADTWLHVTPWIDARADAWATAYADACRAPAAQGSEMSAEISACFDEHRTELDRLLGRFASPDKEVVILSVPAAAELGDPTLCTDPDWLALRPAPPDEPELRAEVEAVHAAMAGAYGRHAPDEMPQAIAEAQSILARSEALGHVPLVAEAQVGLGLLLLEHADDLPAEQAFHAAFEAAMRAGDDATAVLAAIELGAVVIRLARYDEAGAWLEVAGGLIARLQLEGTDVDGRRIAQQCSLLGTIEKRDEALAACERAHAIFEAQLGPTHPATVEAIQDIAFVQFDRSELDEAQRLVDRAIELEKQILGPDHPALASPYRTLGLIMISRMNPAAARVALERSLTLARSRYADDHPNVRTTENSLAQVLMEEGRTAEARVVYERLIERSTRELGEDHPSTIFLIVSLARVWIAERRYPEAFATAQRGAELARTKLGNDNRTLAMALLTMGGAYSRLGEHARAIEAVEESLAIEMRASPVESLLSQEIRRCYASALWRAGRIDDALAQLDVARAGQRDRGEPTSPRHEQLRGEILLGLARLDEAEQAFENAAAAWLARTGPTFRAYGDAVSGLGRVALARGDFSAAIGELERAEPILAADLGAELETALCRFALAEALIGSGADRTRAVELARQAEPVLSTPDVAREHAEVAAWLEKHDPRGFRPDPKRTPRP